jgi:hypothetical protein
MFIFTNLFLRFGRTAPPPDIHQTNRHSLPHGFNIPQNIKRQNEYGYVSHGLTITR